MHVEAVFEEDGTLAECEHLFQQAPNFLPNPAFPTESSALRCGFSSTRKGSRARAPLIALSELRFLSYSMKAVLRVHLGQGSNLLGVHPLFFS